MVLAASVLASAAAHYVTLPNCAGVAGIGLGASWALFARRSTILLCQTVGGLSFALHFFLLGSLAGAIMCSAAASQSLATQLGLRRSTLVTVYAATLGIAGSIIVATSSDGVAPLCAVAGLVFATVGRLQANTQRMRLAFLGCTAAWAIHNFLVGSVIGNVSDVLTLTGILAGLWTHARRARQPEQPCLSAA